MSVDTPSGPDADQARDEMKARGEALSVLVKRMAADPGSVPLEEFTSARRAFEEASDRFESLLRAGPPRPGSSAP